MTFFNEQELINLHRLNQNHINLRKEIDKSIEFLMETKNNVFILEHKKANTILELDDFDSYDDVFNHHQDIISEYKIRWFIIAFAILVIFTLILGMDKIIISTIISIIISSFFIFGSAKRDYSNDILLFLKKQENTIREIYNNRQKMRENFGEIWDIAGNKMVNFIHSQPIVSIDFLKEQGFGVINSEIIELILDLNVDNEEYEIMEVANPNNPNETIIMYKSKSAKNITTTHLQID